MAGGRTAGDRGVEILALTLYQLCMKTFISVTFGLLIAVFYTFAIAGISYETALEDLRKEVNLDEETINLHIQQGIEYWTRFSSISSVLGSFISAFALVLVWKTLKETAESTRILGEEFKAAHPPRFRVHQINLNLAAWMNSSERVGELFVFNDGATDAKIVGSTVVFHTGEHPPPSRPFDQAPNANQLSEPGSIFSKGAGKWWKLSGNGFDLDASELKQIIENKSSKRFFVIGRLHYEDTQGVGRHIVFCRRYDPGTRRFVPTNDPDYEYQT